VEERDTFPFRAEARALVDEADSSGAAASEGTVEIVDGKADVMDAGPTFGDELADRRIGSFGFEQLDEDSPAARPAIRAPSASSRSTSGRPSRSR